MLLNIEEIFSDAQLLTASAASTNILDLGVPGIPQNTVNAQKRDIGPGCPIEFACQIDSLGGGDGGDSTVEIGIEVSVDEAFTAPKVIGTGFMFEDVAPGGRCSIKFIPDFANERYLRLNYTVGGASPEVVVTAAICAGVQTNTSDS